jgi:hypothetical protein
MFSGFKNTLAAAAKFSTKKKRGKGESFGWRANSMADCGFFSFCYVVSFGCCCLDFRSFCCVSGSVIAP